MKDPRDPDRRAGATTQPIPAARIAVHIDHVVLDGLPISWMEGSRVHAAIESELSRLIESGGLSADLMSGGALPSLPSSAIRGSAAREPERLGLQIAQAVYRSIGS